VALSELLDLVIRWVHLVAGIMWIGNSMLFNWLDRNLVPPPDPAATPSSIGKMWMVHSGYFYEVEKKLLAPNEMPRTLHWFYWQNRITWLSGICLLVVVYYMNGAAFLVNPEVTTLGPLAAIGLSVGAIFVAVALYELYWTVLAARPRVAILASLATLAAMTYGLAVAFSGRAAFIHVGVILGTCMTGNVNSVILPSQRELVAATRAGREQDPRLAAAAKTRSIHNNYMTFPLLFIMVSNHFPATYGDSLNWVILAVLMAGGATVRHFMNMRYHQQRWLEPALAAAAISLAATVALTSRGQPAHAGAAAGPVSYAEVHDIVTRRCTPCHSARPTDTLFAVPPGGVMLDTAAQVRAMAPRIMNRAVETKTMPFANRTLMTDAERARLGQWVEQGAVVP
jgi:uncharacterized membrane protein